MPEAGEQWPLAHAGDAVDAEAPRSQWQGCREETHRRAGISDEQIGRSRGKGSSAALDPNVQAASSDSTCTSELVQRRRHVPGVVAVQGAGQRAFAIGKRSDEQCPVGDALRAGTTTSASTG